MIHLTLLYKFKSLPFILLSPTSSAPYALSALSTPSAPYGEIRLQLFMRNDPMI